MKKINLHSLAAVVDVKENDQEVERRKNNLSLICFCIVNRI